MFYPGYCDYNRSNPDYDMINRPSGSGDYLFLYLITPMRIQLGTETIVTKENAFLLYTPGEAQIYQAVRRFKNSFVHFTCDEENFLKDYDLPANRVVYLPDPGAMNTVLRSIYMENVLKQDFYPEQADMLLRQLFILFPDSCTPAAVPSHSGRPLRTVPQGADRDTDPHRQAMDHRQHGRPYQSGRQPVLQLLSSLLQPLSQGRAIGGQIGTRQIPAACGSYARRAGRRPGRLCEPVPLCTLF